MKFDFSGYATKNNLKCSDGRVIIKDAFKHNDGQTVPLVWQHMHNAPDNILGHALLENREDGVYAYAKFNTTPAGENAKTLVEHGDITALSIYANQLKQQGESVLHGAIREVSLVLAGANPGAFIDNLNFAHSDGSVEPDESEAVIYTGLSFDNVDIEHSGEEKTVAEVFETLSEEQKSVVYAMIADALGSGEEKEDEVEHKEDDDTVEHSNEGGIVMKKNVFDAQAAPASGEAQKTLAHFDFAAVVADAKNHNGSLKEAILAHAGVAGVDYGVTDIGFLFPDAQTVTPTPEVISRDMEWVAGVLSGTKHSPFSRIKSTAVDITAEEARALGYVTGAFKKEEVIKLLKRITTPTTIYKKQKLDRDDIVDITDFNVVSWLQAEMRLMLNEEIARAILIGDGRDAASDDKINEELIRPIASDDDMYAHKVGVANDATIAATMEAIIRAREFYKGSGSPALFTTTSFLNDMLLQKDTLGRRLYNSKSEVATALLVDRIVEVPVMAGTTRTDDDDNVLTLLGIIVNLKDYTVGADKGGPISLFDDFDIDYNQYKYLMETRASGALTKPKSALVIERQPVDFQ